MEDLLDRILGLDVGSKTIGVAISDPFKIIAQGLETYIRVNLEDDLDYLLKVIEDNNVGTIVCGLPKNMNNSIGPSAQKVMNFANRLRDKSGKDLIYEDERLSSVSAGQILMDSQVRRENRKKHVDKIAASFILQTYLDRRNLNGKN